MTIDEYLNQLRDLKRREARLYKKMLTAHEKAIAPRSSFNYDMPRSRSSENTTEAKLIESADALREWRNVNQQIIDAREKLQSDIMNMLYWEGCLIEQVYVYNLYRNQEDNLYGAEELLKTNNRREILAKLRTAKEHLAEILRDQGIEIE